MRRKIKDLISLKASRHLFYIPIIIFKINNWYSFLLNYIGLRNEPNEYKFRSGIRIKTNEGVDAATIAVIFIKKDYGKINDNYIVIDIGANIGVFSVYAVAVSKDTKVYAYEPYAKSYELLLENIKINKFENSIVPFKLGVGAHKVKRKLFLASSSPFHSLYSDKKEKYIEIECITLKDIFINNKINYCNLLKMDCEGSEFEILYNTPKEYLSKIKEIRLEYHNQEKDKYNIKDLTKFLVNNGFKVIKFRSDYQYSGNAWFRRT
mgnify:CR=1 FL=1